MLMSANDQHRCFLRPFDQRGSRIVENKPQSPAELRLAGNVRGDRGDDQWMVLLEFAP
jgi:hypothetical protein